MTPEVARGMASVEWDALPPDRRAAFAHDRALYVPGRAAELVGGTGPRSTVSLAAATDRATADARAAEAKAKAGRFTAVDPVALGEWRKDWRYDRAGCRQRFASEEDYLAARHAKESAGHSGDLRERHRRTY